MKKTALWFVKAAGAALVAFGLMSVFCFFYYNLPVHYPEPSGASDYSWDKNALSMRGTEGFSYQFTDERGYVNSYPRKDDQIDILVMGSSHTEGFHVNYDENYTYVLNKLLDEGGHDLFAYNIAASGHSLERNIDNLDQALDEFKPSKYVVIEVPNLKVKTANLVYMLEGNLGELESSNSGIVGALQKSDALRLLYYQISQVEVNKKLAAGEEEDPWLEYHPKALRAALKKAAGIAKEHGVQLIITHLSLVDYDYNGNFCEPEDIGDKELYKQACEEYGIIFLDMYSAYEQMYNSTNRLPRGYCNTAPGVGHTNKYGHACVAQELYKCITKEEIE